jgi:hypothetical protein
MLKKNSARQTRHIHTSAFKAQVALAAIAVDKGFKVDRRHIGIVMAKMDIYAVWPTTGHQKTAPGP